MKKYSSHADLKLHPSLHYHTTVMPNKMHKQIKSPISLYGDSNNVQNISKSKVGSPSFKKAILYDNPVMMISRDQGYQYNACSTPTPASVKYSAAYAMKKKISMNQKSESSKSNYFYANNNRKQNCNNNTNLYADNYLQFKSKDQQCKAYNNYQSSVNDTGPETHKKIEQLKKTGDSKTKKNSSQVRQSRQKLQKYSNVKEKSMKLTELDVKGYTNKINNRLDVQSPKSNEVFFKNAQKEKQKEREREQKIRSRLKEKKQTASKQQKQGSRDKKQNKEIKDKQNKPMKEKNGSMKKQSKQKKQEEELNTFITKYQSDIPLLLHCTSQTNIVPNQLRPLSFNQSNSVPSLYYIHSLYSSFFGTKSNQNKLSTFQQICRNHLQTSIQFLTYARKNKNSLVPTVPHMYVDFEKNKYLNIGNENKILKSRSEKQSSKKHKNTIIFDLDETLIHCNQSLDLPHDIQIQIQFPNSTKIKAGINIRNHALECLKELSQYFQIIVFTASHQCYANKIINHLDPQNKYVSHRLFREHCYKTKQGFYVKDLRVLQKQLNLENVLLIDNAAYSYCFQPQNGVPAIPFYNNKTDWELKEIVKYLKNLLTNSRSIQEQNDEYMKLGEYYKFRQPKQLINQLYL